MIYYRSCVCSVNGFFFGEKNGKKYGKKLSIVVNVVVGLVVKVSIRIMDNKMLLRE